MQMPKSWILFSLAVVFGLMLIVGATRNLPASAQGLVTGRNDILIDRLAERVGDDALAQAVLDAELVEVNPRRAARENGRRDDRRRGDRRRENRRRDGRRAQEMDGALDDQLERIGPDVVYQIAVDAGLLAQVEADRMLSE